MSGVRRFSPLLLVAAVVALVAAMRRNADPTHEKTWKPVEPS